MNKTNIGFLAFVALCIRCTASLQAQITVLTSLNGSNGFGPYGDLTLSADGHTLYGVTSSNSGSIFSVPTTGGSPTILTTYDGSAGVPNPGLALVGSTLYGTMNAGGTSSDGTVFSLSASGGSPMTLANFSGSNGVTPSAGLTVSTDGQTLYGVTEFGGAHGLGEVFSVPIGGGAPTVLASFSSSDLSNPFSRLTLSGGILYGITQSGGANGDGGIFSVPVGGGAPTVLTSFSSQSFGNSVAQAALVVRSGLLYGATSIAGTNNDGTIFSLPVTGGTPTVLANFNGTTGAANPQNGLVLIGNTIYGEALTSNGGFGEIFSLPVAGGATTDVADFNFTNGNEPDGGLVASGDGSKLYGATFLGGGNSDGVIFSVATGVPEPGTAGLLVGGLLAVLVRRKRG